MEVVKSITNSLNNYVFNLSEEISIKYNIPLEDLLQLWCRQQNISFNSTFLPLIKISSKQKKISTARDNEIEENTSDEIIRGSVDGVECSYIFTRGPKKGTRCPIFAKNGRCVINIKTTLLLNKTLFIINVLFGTYNTSHDNFYFYTYSSDTVFSVMFFKKNQRNQTQ